MNDQAYIAGKLHQFVIEQSERRQGQAANYAAAREAQRGMSLWARLFGKNK